MLFRVAITDNDWYHFLAARRPDEVNFWRPGGQSFGAIPRGAPFLFKLHAPYHYIVGGGYFVNASTAQAVPASDMNRPGSDCGSRFLLSDAVNQKPPA